MTGCDDEAIYIENPLWKAQLSRSNLEKGVTLIEEGVIDKNRASSSKTTAST